MQMGDREPEEAAEDRFAHACYLSMTMYYARIIEQAILSCGITSTQYRIIFRLIGHRGSLRIGQLADALDMGASAATGSVAQLESIGAAIRVDGVQDHRAVHVLVTDYGRHLARTVDQALRPIMEDIRDDFPLDLRRYASVCTLEVARLNSLFGEEDKLRNVNAALCDEILLTSALVSRIAHDEGLSLTEYRVLMDLLEQDRGARPNEIAQHLGVRRNGIAAAQSELLRRGFVSRKRDPLDRRAVILDITSVGFGVLQRAAIAMNEGLHGGIFPGLTSEDLAKHRRLASEVLHVRGLSR